MEKVLIIDPRAVTGSTTLSFTVGHISGLKKYYEIDFVTPYNCNIEVEKINHIKVFYKNLNKIKNSKIKKVYKGLSYWSSYKRIIKLIKKFKYNFVEIEWTVLPLIDIRFIEKIKRLTKLIIRAHNILPHSTGSKYYKSYKTIYKNADLIIVHGQTIKQQMLKCFSFLDESKIAVQLFGQHGVKSTTYNKELIDTFVIKKIENSNKVFLCVGRIDEDKGFDRVVKIWSEAVSDSSNLLIIAGKTSGETSLKKYDDRIKNSSNVIFFEGYIDDNFLNYLFCVSDIILLPYREGSMSGVAFTAAQFSKPILATDFGSIKEYLNDECGWLCKNDDASLKEKILEIINNFSKEQIVQKGNNFSTYIRNTANWQKIVDDLYSNYLSKFVD